MIDNGAFLAAHNAPFDRSVLHACCEMSGLKPTTVPFLCTVALARKEWNIFPTKLPLVCSHLGIPLDHHNAASDAEACARIVLAARR
jgi:DNA polymerase III subunit epsilon